MNGHCRHCDERLCMCIGATGLTEHQGKWGARWMSWCPACAEAERIAAWCDEQSAKESRAVFGRREAHAAEIAYDAAADFARGDS